MTTEYEKMGVEARKKGIGVFKSSIDNLFPNAFCTVARDPDRHGQGLVLHTDSAGSKPVQNYLHWKETGDIEWFKSMAQDAFAMNVDDLICIGASPKAFVDYVALNKNNIPKEKALAALNSGFSEMKTLMDDYGIGISFLGGETADLPDQMRTIDVSVTMHGRIDLDETIDGEDIEPGNLIVGLRSGGQTEYEKEKKSGIQCNGITLARHSLMKGEYEEKYPEIGGSGVGYYGKYSIFDSPGELDMSVGEAIISPTRIYAPVIKEMLDRHRSEITGMVHNTGGGLTKSLAIGENIHYIKDNTIEPDPIFKIIQEESEESWRAMQEDYNMGTGFEIVVEEEAADDLLSIADEYNLEGKVIGRCERSQTENKVTIKNQFGNFVYEKKRE